MRNNSNSNSVFSHASFQRCSLSSKRSSQLCIMAKQMLLRTGTLSSPSPERSSKSAHAVSVLDRHTRSNKTQEPARTGHQLVIKHWLQWTHTRPYWTPPESAYIIWNVIQCHWHHHQKMVWHRFFVFFTTTFKFSFCISFSFCTLRKAKQDTHTVTLPACTDTKYFASTELHLMQSALVMLCDSIASLINLNVFRLGFTIINNNIFILYGRNVLSQIASM